MLDALKNDEKKTLQKLQKEKAKASKGKKTEINIPDTYFQEQALQNEYIDP